MGASWFLAYLSVIISIINCNKLPFGVLRRYSQIPSLHVCCCAFLIVLNKWVILLHTGAVRCISEHHA